MVFAGAAAMAQEVALFAQAAFNETHLSIAIEEGGEVLDRYAYDKYRLTRNEAQSAVATLRFNRSSTTEGVTIETDSVVSSDGETFRTINDVPFPVGAAGPFEVLAVAEKTGITGNVAVSTITTIVSAVDDTSITVTNDEPAAGGSLAETDVAFGSRIVEFHVNARRGTRSAIEAGGLATPGVSEATASEGFDPATSEANFRVNLVISDADGQANSALATRVTETLADFRGLGVPVNVLAGVPEFVEVVVVGLEFEAAANTSDVLNDARLAILGAINALAPNKKLLLSLITSALTNVNKLIVPEGAIVVPAGDLIPAADGVIRTKKSLIKLNNT